MWVKTTTSYAFLSAYIYIMGPILSGMVNYPSSYITREGADKYYNRMIHCEIFKLMEKAGKTVMKLQSPRREKLKVHNT